MSQRQAVTKKKALAYRGADRAGEVAGEAIEFVDDGVVDLAVLCEVGQHLLQLGAVGAAGGLAAVGELFDDEGSYGLGFAAVGFALGWQGESLLGPAALGLFAGGDADVGDGAFGGELGGHSCKRVSSDCRCTALC